MTKKQYKVVGMDCESCAKMIELDLEDAGFVAKCNFATQTLEVEMDSKSNKDNVKSILKKSGYGLVDHS